MKVCSSVMHAFGDDDHTMNNRRVSFVTLNVNDDEIYRIKVCYLAQFDFA